MDIAQQPIITLLTSSIEPTATATVTATVSATALWADMKVPYEISSFLRLLSSLTAFREGIVFMTVGLLLEIFRRASFRWSTELYNRLFIRVTFNEEEPCYRESLKDMDLCLFSTSL